MAASPSPASAERRKPWRIERSGMPPLARFESLLHHPDFQSRNATERFLI